MNRLYNFVTLNLFQGDAKSKLNHLARTYCIPHQFQRPIIIRLPYFKAFSNAVLIYKSRFCKIQLIHPQKI